MNSIHDITDYIILRVKSEDRFASLINLKLQKLLYYVQAWSYGINKKPMFDGEFEAWIHGPVNREIYNRFNSTKYLYSEINIDDCMNHNVSLSSEDAEFIDFILENYLKYSGAELERLSPRILSCTLLTRWRCRGRRVVPRLSVSWASGLPRRR